MERFFWFLHLRSAFDFVSASAVPFLIGFALYQIDYVLLAVQRLVAIARGARAVPRGRERMPAALLVLPTLLRTKDELEGLKRAITSVVSNGYPGDLYVVAAIDDGAGQSTYGELAAWARSSLASANVRVFTLGIEGRVGKAVAIDRAVRFIESKVRVGEIEAFPPLFFNMDGDSELGPNALAHMVRRILRRGSWSGERPMIVTSNVAIAPDVYWRGWRAFFSVKGQIAVLVAREYLTSIAIGKFNTRLIPVQEASGALYCTWSWLHVVAPRWAGFMQTLRLRDWLRWWLGAAPPRFATSGAKAIPEAQTGPGDDTWMTWLACCARWRGGEITLEFPRTPAHAAWAAVRAYIVRPVAFEPEARIATKTPTTVASLFRQRIRWNSSRVQDVQRWRPALAYHWHAAIPIAFSTALLLYVHAMIVVSFVVWPFVSERGQGWAAVVVAFGINLVVRATMTVFALVLDRSPRHGWWRLLGLPLAVPYHFAFNVVPTIVGLAEDILLFGVNTSFSPEETCVRSGLSRIAIAYRVRRALALAVRSVIHNDVPLGSFWLGWHATRWTPNGFEGWTTGKRRVLVPRPLPLVQPIPADVPSLRAVSDGP
jgi:hypothetical protein